MPTAFERAFAVVIGEEGGYSNNSRDPGGETKFGVSKRSYPAVDIANLTLDGARAIYERDFWCKVGCDNLPPPLALITFDAAVNAGPGRAARWLQQAVGVTQDGAIGPATLAAVAKHTLADVITEFMARRMLFQLTLPTVATFGLGWARRLARLELAAMAMEGLPSQAPQPALNSAASGAVISTNARLSTSTEPGQPGSPPHFAPTAQEWAEVLRRRELEDKAFTDALNQRPQ